MKLERRAAGVLALVVASTIWGASFVLSKVALAEIGLEHLLLYRFGFAILPLLPILIASRIRPRRRDLWLLVLTGFLMVPVTFLLQIGGLALTSATSAALLIGTGAPLLAVAAVLFEGERLGRRGWLSVGISCVGVVLLVGVPGAGDDWRGNLMVVLSMVASTVWVITSKRLVARYPATHVTGWLLLIGTALLSVSLLWSGPPPVDLSFGAWGSLLALGFGCTTLAYVLWNWGVAQVGAGPAGVYLNLEPIAGAALGVVVMGDPVGAGVVAGGVLILVAAGIITPGRAARLQKPRVSGRGSGWWHRDRPSLQAELALEQFGLSGAASGRGAPLVALDSQDVAHGSRRVFVARTPGGPAAERRTLGLP